MALTYAGTTITVPKYNGTTLTSVNCNGTNVYTLYKWNRYNVNSTPVYTTKYRWSADKSLSGNYWIDGSAYTVNDATQSKSAKTPTTAVTWNAATVIAFFSSIASLSDSLINSSGNIIVNGTEIVVSLPSNSTSLTGSNIFNITNKSWPTKDMYYYATAAGKVPFSGFPSGGFWLIAAAKIKSKNYIDRDNSSAAINTVAICPGANNTLASGSDYRAYYISSIGPYFRLAHSISSSTATITLVPVAKATKYRIVESYQVQTSTNYSQGSYIDQVTSTNASAYPANGKSGDYWYVKV